MTKKKILIVDDYQPIIDLYREWLKDIYAVHEASDGEEAITKYKKIRPDLVLMDILMPGKMGDEAMRDIMEYDPEAKVIALTAYPYSEDQLGVPVLRKGFKKEQFLQILDACCG